MQRTQTEPGLQLLDIPPLGSALPSDFIVCTLVVQSGAGAARRPLSITLELPLPTYDASDPLLLRFPRLIVIHCALWFGGGFVVVGGG